MSFRLNAAIPGSIQQPDVVNTLARSDAARMRRGEEAQQNALRSFLSESGDALYRGDANALGEYAKYDPQAAFGMKAQQERLAMDRERLQLARAAGARAAANARLTREEKAKSLAEAQELRTLLMLRDSNPEAFADRLRMPEYVSKGVTVDNFDTWAAMADGYAGELYSQYQDAQPEPEGPLSTLGKIQADKDAGRLPPDTPLRSSESISVGPDGAVQITRGTPPPKLTVEAGKNTGFYLRTLDANKVLDQFDMQGASLPGRALESIPGGMGNYLQSPEYQQFEQARRDFVNAILRRESGAVISVEEFANAERQYFPVPGDSAEVVQQKRQNRINAIEGLRIGAGAGGPYVDGLNAGADQSSPDALDAVEALESDLARKYPQFFD